MSATPVTVATIGITILLLGSIASPSGAQTWTPPIGIPTPAFGITEAAPPSPNPWTSAVPGFYYVDEFHSAATDTNNPYGWPAKPRRTIPLSVPAGSIVELHGIYTKNHRSPANLTLNGTLSAPVFVRGTTAARVWATQPWQVSGQHFVVENVDFYGISQQFVMAGPIWRGVFRFNTIRGTLEGGGIGMGGASGYPVSEAVIFENEIHDNGDLNAGYDQDRHGIAVSAYVQYLFVLENELYRNSGDGIQINAGNQTLQSTTHHIYVGRNVSHNNKQTGMWTKQAVDVIFSQNLVYSHRPSNSSYGACMGFQYAPEHVWFLYNWLLDCEFGIGLSSDSGLGFGQYSFIIGNLIQAIHRTTPFDPSAWGQSAIMMAGGVYRYVLNNTIFDVASGIQCPGGGAIALVNNIIGGITEPLGNHVNIANATTAGNSGTDYELYEGAVRIKWGGNTVYNLSAFQATFGQGLNSLNVDPLFVDPTYPTYNFRLQASSPAVDSGHTITQDIAAYFLSRYGLNIAVDSDGTSRPQGAGWDLGSFERVP